jgi:hypothetical protein
MSAVTSENKSELEAQKERLSKREPRHVEFSSFAMANALANITKETNEDRNEFIRLKTKLYKVLVGYYEIRPASKDRVGYWKANNKVYADIIGAMYAVGGALYMTPEEIDAQVDYVHTKAKEEELESA